MAMNFVGLNVCDESFNLAKHMNIATQRITHQCQSKTERKLSPNIWGYVLRFPTHSSKTE